MKKIVWYIVVFIAGWAISAVVSVRSHNVRIQKAAKQAQDLKEVNEKAQDSLGELLTASQDSVKVLSGKIYQDSVNYAAERLKIIPNKRVKELEATILTLGVALYGPSNDANSRRALVASYGANAAQEAEHSRKIIKDQKVQIVYIGEILELENEIRVEYQQGLELAAAKCKNPKALQSAGIGFGLGILVVLLLL